MIEGANFVGCNLKELGIVMVLDSAELNLLETAITGIARYISGYLHEWYYEVHGGLSSQEYAALISDAVRVLMAHLLHLCGPVQDNDVSCGIYALANAAYLLDGNNLIKLKQRANADRRLISQGQRTYRNLKRTGSTSAAVCIRQCIPDLYTESFIEYIVEKQKSLIEKFLQEHK